MGDRGQATPMMAAAVGLVALMLLAIGPMGRALTDRAQARTAADAAALAGAAEGEETARTVAGRNGAELVSFEREGAEVTVEVSVDGVSAHSRARARQVPSSTGIGGGTGGGTGEQAGLAPAMVAALQRAEDLLGEPVPVTSGYRSPERQRELWEQRHTNPFPVAPPGSSRHERGLAVDIPSSFVGRLLEVADQVGLCQTLPASDPIHFELCGAG
jgi:hypothetical protein